MKKLLSLLLVFAMVLSLASCTKQETPAQPQTAPVSSENLTPDASDLTEEETDAEPSEDEEESADADAESAPETSPDASVEEMNPEYAAIIDRYAQAIGEGWDMGTMMDEELAYMIPDCINAGGKVGYLEADFNGDGVTELAIAADADPDDGWFYGMIFDFYAMMPNMETGEVVATRLFTSGERDRWYFWGDNCALNIGSGSAFQSFWHICSADWELAYVDCLEYDSVTYPDDPWMAFDGETWNHISEEEADSRMESLEAGIKSLELRYIG